jgi:hypothetical protein
LNRRVIEPYTADEMKVSSAQADLDGPLLDYVAKGTRIELVGMEKVEGHDTYKKFRRQPCLENHASARLCPIAPTLLRHGFG